MVELLDCTLRDGAYIVDGIFGDAAIRGIISKLQNAGVEIIECGWLKNSEHKFGTTYYHTPSDLVPYIGEKNKDCTYVVMIDWDRYDLDYLPDNDGKSIDAIRVVFPVDKFHEGLEVGKKIKEKGYRVFFQAANTMAYTEEQLKELAKGVNDVAPEGIAVVDTFGVMYEEDLERILSVLDANVKKGIKLGFHSHNNQQMAFANAMFCARFFKNKDRDLIIDASLCGMGRGAGNATTELMINFLNSKCNHNYDFDAIMDAIDIYMTGFQEKYTWGYSTPYFIAGMYCCHVNNIAYLQNNHRTSAHDMRNIIESLSPDDRKKYDYDLLEEKYLENQSQQIDDSVAIATLRADFGISNDEPRKILLLAPGKSVLTNKEKIKAFIDAQKPIVIAVNAILPEYEYDYLFLTNSARYEYASKAYPEAFSEVNKILLSNVKNEGMSDEYIVNFNRAIKRGWPHFDNAVICALRLMDRLHAKNIYIAGFDGFKEVYNESYADEFLPTLNPSGKWDELNAEIKEMFLDVKETTKLDIEFITESLFSDRV